MDLNKKNILNSLLTILLVAGAGLVIYQTFFANKFDLPKPNSEEAMNLKHSIPLDEILDGGPGKDGIPSIDNPKFISVAEAKEQFKPLGLGLLVEHNGEQRYYSYQILVWHELVNDQIGDLPILVSFCPLCGSGLVFDRTIDGEAVEFGVSGKLHNSDLLMYDRKTDSLWAQILGEAVVGELTGSKLTQLPSNLIDFQTFISKFPNGKVLSKETSFTRNYENGPYGNYDTSDDLIFPVNNRSNILPPKTRVLGVELNGQFKAYPMETIKQKLEIIDSFADTQIKLEYNDGLIKITNLTDPVNKEIVPTNTFWFGWFAFHPDTLVYTE